MEWTDAYQQIREHHYKIIAERESISKSARLSLSTWILDILTECLDAEQTEPTHGKMLICPNCGLEVHSDFDYCPRCGADVMMADRKTDPQTYVINPQEPTNDDKCFECDDFFTCGGQCNKIEDEPQTDAEYIKSLKAIDEKIAKQTDCAWK